MLKPNAYLEQAKQDETSRIPPKGLSQAAGTLLVSRGRKDPFCQTFTAPFAGKPYLCPCFLFKQDWLMH